MSHLSAVFTTIIALLTGGGIATLGQALSDRRARRREREARRETFLIHNFDSQLKALVQVQELALGFERTLIGEYVNDTVFPGKRAPLNKLEVNASLRTNELGGLLEKIEFLSGQTKSGASPEAAKKELEHTLGALRETNKRIQEFTVALKEQAEFGKRFIEFTQELYIYLPRTGSAEVFSKAMDYLEAINNYIKGRRLISAKLDKLIEEIQQSRTVFHGIISSAMREGPYTTY